MSQQYPDDRRRIDLDDDADRWRYVCPRGHTSWEPTNFHFWCSECAQNWLDVDPEFEELTDRREAVSLSRDEVELVTEVGTYRDLYKSGGHA